MKKNKFTLADVVIYLLLTLLALSIILAFLHLINLSISPSYVATSGGLLLFPKEVIWDNYKSVITNHFIWTGYGVTILRSVVGTVLSLLFTSMGAYVLSKKYFPHRTFWTLLIVFTMFFSGGLIPNYLLIKRLGMVNTFASLVIPGLVSAYNLVIMRNFFQGLPEEIEESCMMDGAGRFRIFWQFVLPLSKPILATIGLWLVVGHWNSWFDALIYITNDKMLPLQVVLRRIIVTGSKEIMDMDSVAQAAADSAASSEGLKAASIIVATLPILCVYPSLQKYFVKGIMIGSLKG